MIRIDMTEEPEDELDIIFKAQNIYDDGHIQYVVPIKFKGKTYYVDDELRENSDRSEFFREYCLTIAPIYDKLYL